MYLDKVLDRLNRAKDRRKVVSLAQAVRGGKVAKVAFLDPGHSMVVDILISIPEVDFNRKLNRKGMEISNSHHTVDKPQDRDKDKGITLVHKLDSRINMVVPVVLGVLEVLVDTLIMHSMDSNHHHISNHHFNHHHSSKEPVVVVEEEEEEVQVMGKAMGRDVVSHHNSPIRIKRTGLPHHQLRENRLKYLRMHPLVKPSH